MSARTVGVIGLGAMGFPMALRVAAAGHRVWAVEANPDRCDDARAAGLEICDIAKLADADIVLVLVATEAQLDAVLQGGDGALTVMRPGATCVVMSTVGPAAVQKVAARAEEFGIAVLDIPVTGGVSGAAAGSLTLLAGGDPATLAEAQPVLTTMGSVSFCGERVGDGQAVKVVNQLLCSVHLAAAAEALTLARRLGLDTARVLEAVRSGAGGSWMLNDRGPRMLDDDAPTLTALGIFVKDSDLVAAAAVDADCEVPLLQVSRDKFRTAAQLGFAAADDSRVYRAYD
ncbi:NAD(P)-dependent oxidoreductase [Mycobacterium sp. AMU20-3851]|uniref:NAD(P)-dependent oxidoreductase n=1 Tax=Mycobacterium sp. AMU20-3851 TaxID=3122055 RepID=UPI003754CDE9